MATCQRPGCTNEFEPRTAGRPQKFCSRPCRNRVSWRKWEKANPEKNRQRNVDYYESLTHESVIYFVMGEATGLIKIGHTTKIRKRVRDLQVGSPEKLTLVGTIPGGKEKEEELHERFADVHSHGEWFEALPVLAWLRTVGTASDPLLDDVL